MKRSSDLNELVTSEARVMLLYATREEAADILSAAGDLHLTGENFVWIVTQSVLGSMQQPNKFPVGMLGTYPYQNCITSILSKVVLQVFQVGVITSITTL